MTGAGPLRADALRLLLSALPADPAIAAVRSPAPPDSLAASSHCLSPIQLAGGVFVYRTLSHSIPFAPVPPITPDGAHQRARQARPSSPPTAGRVDLRQRSGLAEGIGCGRVVQGAPADHA